MNKAMLLLHEWHRFNAFNFAILICLINAVNVSSTQPAASDCVLSVETPSSFNNSRCFVDEGCSGGEFCAYLYALSVRANQTGKIFLSWDEQRECFRKRNNGNEGGFLGCGMEKLMAGGGGCSDYSILDIKNELGYDLNRLKGGCGTTHWDKPCSSCRRRWEEMKETQSRSGGSMKADSEMCSFAVLITLISAEIENEAWASNLFSCLGKEQISSDSEVAEGTGRKKIGPGFYMLTGGVVGVMVVMIVSILVFRCSIKKAIAPVDKDVWRRPALSKFPSMTPAISPLLNESGILSVLVKEVYSATNNLGESNFIGEGTAGKVYRGVLFNKQHVAIKQITNDDTYMREIRSLVHVKHPNLVPLLGYCENGSECFLIYELCPNGNLSDWLYGKYKALPWLQRLEIAVGSARGLRFLHTFPQGCIVHRDVKPANILLGTNLEAKLSDFGLSKVMNLGESSVSSEIRGTFGYVDPEYQTNCHISAASDIYSFGVVLLQILSGRKVIDMNRKQPKPLDKIAKSVVKTGNMVEFADTNLHGEFSVEAFVVVFELALSCTGEKRQRPSIVQVVVKLEEALRISVRMEASTPRTTPDWYNVP
ncbi:hypothetical protein C2S53_000186 [Perilla frutescens var. hirtella]|uniref:Protein kinase domain-containing protein n=1 Tax=Perilla frutescens var. hirtella TaxID=608512 RepID=A0AAD4P902_PERFH|nr:hypothetical protein C2S53_000186 [Perilla frutescens var. hirtella]